MNKSIFLLILLFFFSNCSLNSKTGFWSKSELTKEEDPKINKVFKETKILDKELNSNIKINFLKNTELKLNSFINNLTNNNGNINYVGELKKVFKYKFSKIDQFEFTQPDLLFTDDKSIIFFNDKGTIFKFDSDSNRVWNVNHYKKSEKKLNPILFFASNSETLIVTDNISNYYALNLKNGEILWKKNSTAPFNSQIKIYKDKFFAVDFDNVLRCFSLQNGKEIWNFKTEKSFIKSQQKLSLIISQNRLIFINTLGDLSAVNISNGNLLWQTPTQNNTLYEEAFSLKNSDLVYENNSIYFSNNKNELFSIDFRTGTIRWKQKINSSLRPTIIDNLLFTVSKEGLLIVVDVMTGNIIRMTNVLDTFKNYKTEGIEPTGFIVAKTKIYLSLNNGRLVVINAVDGKSIDIIKIDGDKISRPYVLDKNMYVIRNNAIIKIN